MKNTLNATMLGVLVSAGWLTAGEFGRVGLVQIQKNPSVRAAEYGQFTTWFFDFTEINLRGEVVNPKPGERLRYLQDKDLSNEARQQLVKVQTGISRATLDKTWLETGGFVPCQHLLYERSRGSEYVTVRIEWRPAAMPERVYADKNLRARWLKRHVPLPAPDDVAMRVSRPYLAKYVTD